MEYRPASAFRWEVDEYLSQNGLAPTSKAEVDDAFLMLESVVSSNCVAFVPRSVARDAVRTKRVKALTAFHKAHGRLATVTAVRPAGRYGTLDLAGDKVRHAYAKAGAYQVRLTVSDGSGLACGQASQEIEVSVTNRQ